MYTRTESTNEIEFQGSQMRDKMQTQVKWMWNQLNQ